MSLNTSIMNLDRSTIDPNKYDLFAIASHEIDEALGFGSALNGLANGAATPTGAVEPLDLFRYSAPGVRSFSTDASAFAYFSFTGINNLAQFNQTAGGDYSDFHTGIVAQVQDAFATPGATPNLAAELTGLDVIGYNLAPAPEPGTSAMLLSAALAAFALRRRKAHQKSKSLSRAS